MSLEAHERAVIEEEARALEAVLDDLREQREREVARLEEESLRARELTGRLVAARRDEDKQMLASDEAISHSLRDYHQDQLKTLDDLLDSPYFARLVLEESDERGSKNIEYKLGLSGNTECRIVDWRKAPLARLFYEYREGDEYCEMVQGKERNGRVSLRRKVSVSGGILRKISSEQGTFELGEDRDWRKSASSARLRAASAYSSLPSILSLLTPEQYRTISQDTRTAILIQGVAGSGKTSVALHRLAYILHGDNSDIRPDECVVLVLTGSLRDYIAATLPSLEIHGVDVLTFREWTTRCLAAVFGGRRPRRPANAPHPGVERVLRSMALLRRIEEDAARWATGKDSVCDMVVFYRQQIISVLSSTQAILAYDETGLLDRDLVEAARSRIVENSGKDLIDFAEDPLLLRLHQLCSAEIIRAGGLRGPYRHVVVDEVQDYAPAELAAIIGSALEPCDLTLVGDVNQAISSSGSFPGWEKLRRYWSLADSLASYVTLDVSHRSTAAIMRLADYVLDRTAVTSASPASNTLRPGKRPLWLKCRTEERGVRESIGWLERVLRKFPGSLVAVICADEQEVKYAYSLLVPTFGPVVRTASDDSLSMLEGIIVTHVHQVKGLEFPNVLIWNPSRKAYAKTSRHRNLLYVAMTRAQELLCLVTWGAPSPFLPSITSGLLRGIPLEEEDPDSEHSKD